VYGTGQTEGQGDMNAGNNNMYSIENGQMLQSFEGSGTHTEGLAIDASPYKDMTNKALLES